MGKKGHLGDLAPDSDLADPVNMGVVTIALDANAAAAAAPAPKAKRQPQPKGGAR
jgi:hypothetical protein